MRIRTTGIVMVIGCLCLCIGPWALAQDSPPLPAPMVPPVPTESPATLLPEPLPGGLNRGPTELEDLPPALDSLDDESVGALLRRLKSLEDDVKDVKLLRERVAELEQELETLKSPPVELDREEAAPIVIGRGVELADPHGRSFDQLYDAKHFGRRATAGERGRANGNGNGNGNGGEDGGDSDPTAGYSNSGGEGTFSAGGGGGSGPNSGGTSSGSDPGEGSIGRGSRVGEREPLQLDLRAKYKYNFAGGFLQFADEDGEFVANIQNILTLDGTYYDRQNAPTDIKGFNILFQRLYLYGNITKNWEYQISEQSSLGNINLLDAMVNVHYDDRLMIKVGKFLAPFYYQDYATFPMLVPAVAYSPLSQFSAQRQPGVMAWGKLFDNRIQYQAGVFNGIPASFFDLDDNADFISSLTFTPFMASDNERLQNLGFGVSSQVGWQNYMLNAVDVPTMIDGTDTPILNKQFVTASNVPFFIYRDDVRALGERVRVAPHLFYYDRFSFLGEYVFQSRELASPSARGTSIQHGFYATGSYFLTGERYRGDGTGGFPTIIPNRPFNPTNNEYGPGAHELAFQYTLLDVGTSDMELGFADPIWANRLSEIMLGYNWWPNKYVRLSVNWIHDEFNRPIPWPVSAREQRNGVRTNPIQEFNTVWFRLAMFF